MSSTFSSLADLPLDIEACSLEGLSKDVSMGFERLSTVVHLHGSGEEGVGEDVVYDPGAQRDFQRTEVPKLAGSWTLAEFGRYVDSLDLFTSKPLFEAFRRWRRWALHSAALDLALRQAGRALHDALEIEPRPVAFVLSRRVDGHGAVEELRELLGRYPDLRLKLDATPSWDDQVVSELAQLDAITTVDFKSYSPDLNTANAPDPAMYQRIAHGLPDVWLEDPDVSAPEAAAALAPHRDRITWDAPVRSLEDIQSLAVQPQMVNIKPSRFGSLEAVCAAYDFCAEQGIGVYAGGQFELGVGRGQAQYLASLLHPDHPNDIAPAGYNDPLPPSGLPSSPLAPVPLAVGFRWQE